MEKTKENKITTKWIIAFVIANLIVIICSLIQKSTWILTISSLCGVSYVLLIAKENKWAFVLGAINVATYGYILLGQKVYGGVFYNIVYSLPMMIYGLFAWNKANKKENSGIKLLNTTTRLALLIIFGLAIIGYMIFLKSVGGQIVLLDAITTVLGFLGVYLMTNKYFEQWYVWIVSNIANTIMWVILTAQNIYNLPMLIMWAIYLINSFYGYFMWKKKI